MLIGIDSSPCGLSLRNRSTLCSTTKCHQNKSDLKNVFVQKFFFFNIFYSFNPNHAYWNQRRLFSGNLPGMFAYAGVIFVRQRKKSQIYRDSRCRFCFNFSHCRRLGKQNWPLLGLRIRHSVFVKTFGEVIWKRGFVAEFSAHNTRLGDNHKNRNVAILPPTHRKKDCNC